MSDLAALQKILDPLFPGLMGVRLVEVAPDRVLASTQVWQTMVRNADGKLCAVVTQTQLVLAPAA